MYTTKPAEANASKKALFLDRDGVINHMIRQGESYDSPQNAGQITLVDGIAEVIAWANSQNIPVIEISNQPGAAKGKMSMEALNEIDERVFSLLRDKGAHINRRYLCVHHPKGTVSELAIECECRKPGIGLFKQAESELGIDIANSVFIGDNVSDMRAGEKAGCKTVFFFHTEDTPEKVEKNREYLAKEAKHISKSHAETLALVKGLLIDPLSL